AFVASRGLLAKIFLILEVHVDGAEAHDRAGNLGRKLERDSFFGLDVQHQLIRHQMFDGRVAEEHEGRPSKLYHDLSITHRHTLAGSQVEGNVGPAPVVDQQFHGDEGLGARIRGDIGLGPVGGDALAVFGALAILAAHAAAEDVFIAGGLDGVENFGLLVADGVGVAGDGRLHGGEADELHDVVGHHIAQRAGVIEISAAAFEANFFSHRDLDMVDVTAVPDRLEDSVGEAEGHDVLDGFFSEIVIDAVDLFFVGDFEQLLVERFSGVEIVAEGFLDDYPPPVVVVLGHQSGVRELLDDRAEKSGRGGQVVEKVLMSPVILIDLVEKVVELRVEFVVFEVSGKVVETAGEPLPELVFGTFAAIGADVVVNPLAEFIGRQLGASHANHGELAGEQVGAGEVVERRDQHASGEIAGRAEDHHDARIALFADARRCGCDLFRYLCHDSSFWFESWSFAPSGLVRFFRFPHGLRRGLYSYAASRLAMAAPQEALRDPFLPRSAG